MKKEIINEKLKKIKKKSNKFNSPEKYDFDAGNVA
jgi:hypothetical protein